MNIKQKLIAISQSQKQKHGNTNMHLQNETEHKANMHRFISQNKVQNNYASKLRYTSGTDDKLAECHVVEFLFAGLKITVGYFPLLYHVSWDIC